MKTTTSLLLAATLLLARSAATAESWSLANKAGGRIVLSDRPCPDQINGPALLEAYAYTADGQRRSGCWTFFDGLVQIAWSTGQNSVFREEDFTRTPDARPTPAPRKPAGYL